MKRSHRTRLLQPTQPPPEYLKRMERLLGEEEFKQLLRCYAQPPMSGLRVNTLKIPVSDFINKSPFTLSPVGAFEPAGFHFLEEDRPGRHPYHAAGLYYLQDPSAMAVASLIAPGQGSWVLDLAAAPGGKATHLAALMGQSGLLVANDTDQGRVRHLVQNLERWGSRNTVVTNNSPDQLARTCGSLFDYVLLDAPCSGEGMFRRDGSVEWSEQIVAACARRQAGILESAATLVCPGGQLVYATCTFSPEENEETIGRFLVERPDFTLMEPIFHPGFESGRPDWIPADSPAAAQRHQLAKAIRLWPHRFPGEGHFIARLQRAGKKEPRMLPEHPGLSPVPLSALEVWRQFAEASLQLSFAMERLLLVGKSLYLRPDTTMDFTGLSVVRNGLLLGELRQGYFRPAHALALALSVSEAQRVTDWPAGAPQIEAYLGGHTLPVALDDGWALVAVDGFPIGWGKCVRGQMKNHYPRGLRR